MLQIYIHKKYKDMAMSMLKSTYSSATETLLFLLVNVLYHGQTKHIKTKKQPQNTAIALFFSTIYGTICILTHC